MDKKNLIFNENQIKQRLLPCDSPSRVYLRDDFFTKAAVIFSIIPHENKPYELILIHRSDMGTRHRGEMSFPGGKFDPTFDKNLEDTALRETEEEIGVPKENIKLLGCLDDFPTMSQYIITPFLGLIDKDQKLVKDEREVQEIVKIPIDFFTSKTNFREQTIDVEDRKFPVFYFNYFDSEKQQQYTVWGATAYMIVSYIEKIYDLTISTLGLNRFKLEQIKHVKEYIKFRNHLTEKF